MGDDLFHPSDRAPEEPNPEPGERSLVDFLFPAPAPRNAGGIIKWWEKRRLAYNAIVGATGVVSLGLFNLIASLPPNPHAITFLVTPIIVYGTLANICYTLGPAAEIFLEKIFRGKLLPTGPVLFRMGLTFSVGLTMLPTLLAVFDWVIRIIVGIF